jgi:hypothetical protein
MKTIFITRTESEKDFEKLIKLIQTVKKSGINDIYILSNFNKDNYLISNIPVTVICDKKPTSAISINTALQKIKKDDINPDAFLISSKEVDLTKEKTKKLVEEIEANDNLLVVGYKLEMKSGRLDKELKDYYANESLIAYKVPWNTCAMWNYKLFDEYVSKFDEISAKNPFAKISVCVDNVCYETEHEGMEDGLAIAKATSRKRKPKIFFKLLDNHLVWNISLGKEAELKHRKKLARKDKVMVNFMAIRNYSVEDLLNAEMK